jgi:hypothetical protein
LPRCIACGNETYRESEDVSLAVQNAKAAAAAKSPGKVPAPKKTGKK